MTPDDVITAFDECDYRVLERSSEPGDAIVIEVRAPDHCGEPPTRVHPHNVEVFEGEVELFLGSEWQTVRTPCSSSLST